MVAVVVEGKLVARCPPTPQPLLKDGPVRNETGERKASYAQCIGGRLGVGGTVGPLCTASGNLAEEPTLGMAGPSAGRSSLK